ncbi:dephospho-CoA kinase [Chitinimonas koreensis]|uniref:dephospho-CoA kinase n=1 Tax=Chitinimonas koreensis TaxID=356302 RepID=UPI000426EF9D|nr:dephospho-CoA kinase [Chitinimonas koreensis]QNM97200.1 dephospho-CoA kinase [Chitinimonas koreensis]
MRVIGLTGGIGSGKSTVANLFGALGVPVVDTDLIAHALSQPGQPGAAAVARLFGADYLDAAGAIDRPKLRARIFADAGAKAALEAELHPRIRTETQRQLAALPANTAYTLLAVPLLFETGAYRDAIDRALVVDCPEPLQVARVMARSKLTEAEVRAIMAAQLPREKRLAQADDIIVNDGDMEKLGVEVRNLHKKYTQASESQQDSS